MPKSPEQREHELLSRRTLLTQYLLECVRIEDWHGVMDAAADLRETDSELRMLREMGNLK